MLCTAILRPYGAHEIVPNLVYSDTKELLLLRELPVRQQR